MNPKMTASAGMGEDEALHEEAVRRRLDAADWDHLVPRLLLVARRFHQRALCNYRGAPEPMDLVQQAIADVMDGRRRWPQGVPLFNLLYGVMRSHVSNFAARQQPTGPAEAGTRHISLDDVLVPAADALPADIRRSELREAVLRLVEDDPLLERMVELLFEDPHLKASDYAAMLDIPVEDVYNAAKRLKRRATPLRS